MMKRVLFLVAGLLLASWLTAVVLSQEREHGTSRAEPLPRVVEKIGAAVERYQGGLFSIAYTETVFEERLKRDLKTREGKSKEYVFDNVVLRESPKDGGEVPHARNVRRLKSEDGRAAEPGRPYVQRRHKCGGALGPAESYTDPLTFLLPKHHARYEFTDEGAAEVEGRAARVVRFVPRGQGAARVESKGDCFRAVVPYEVRVWADAESGDVLRLESRITDPYAFESPRALKVGGLRFGPKRKLKYERMETLTRFRRVEFKDPAQTLLLPVSTETLRVIEGADRPRVRVTQTFTDYRRFVSDVKVVAEDEPHD